MGAAFQCKKKLYTDENKTIQRLIISLFMGLGFMSYSA